MEKLAIKPYSKAELRTIYNISRETLNTWLKPIEYLLPYYNPKCKVLTPAQVKIIFDVLGTPSEKEEDRKIARKRS
jgi:hypothetical protein